MAVVSVAEARGTIPRTDTVLAIMEGQDLLGIQSIGSGIGDESSFPSRVFQFCSSVYDFSLNLR